jgi:carbamate kinase
VETTTGTIVVALGGNALAPAGERATVYNQFRHTRESLEVIVQLAAEGWRIAIVHGNGPQVGDALERNEYARHEVEPLPLGVLVAGTAGWIGYMIQQSLQNALQPLGINRQVLTVITQSVVAVDDPQLRDPTKPIGNVLTDEKAAVLRSWGVTVGRDGAGRLRRLAPSPTPIDIVESDAVRHLVDEGKIVVAAGGGGPPVYRDADKGWEGLDAVVDKDRSAAVLAGRLAADTLLILTNVSAVYRDWGTDHATPIPRLTVTEAHDLLDTGQLGRGSMTPKLEAAVTFIQQGGRRAVIADLAEGMSALRGETGTTILGETSESS